MKTLQGDVVILGFSLAGIGAATTLRKHGYKVIFCELLADIALREMFEVLNPFDETRVSGAALEALAEQLFRIEGIQVIEGQFELNDWQEASDQLEITLKASGSEPFKVITRSVILAPNGVMPRLDYPVGWERFIGLGVSQSAHSDGPFYAGMPVCVEGCGSWALDQTRMLAQWASKVTGICDRPAFSEPLTPQGIEYRTNSRIVSLNSNESGLQSVSVTENGRTDSISCSGLFLCPDPVMDNRVLGRAFVSKGLVESKKLVSAGVAAGVPFGDQFKLHASGVQAAKSVMRLSHAGGQSLVPET
jgi:thioredoxin reductase